MENCKAMKTNILKTLTTFLIILCSVSANATIDSTNVNLVIPEDISSIFDSKVISKIIPNPGFDPEDPVEPLKPDPISPPLIPGPKKPNPTVFDVGSPKGTFNVNSVGAATYDIEIELPNGGCFSPQIGLSYSSQNGYGTVGYGFNITGISVISRTPKTLSQDGVIKGVSYSQCDAYSYNGKRMVLISGKDGCDGAVYSPLDNPHVKIILHGNDTSNYTWFEVHDAQGIVSRFGYNDNARLLVPVKGYNCIMSWYVSSSEDKRGNCINYSYECSNYCMRPKKIEYGINKNKSRGITCAVGFNYEALKASASSFMVGTTTGSIDKRLAEITTSINSSIYRKYICYYDFSSDAGYTKFARLTKINVSNGEDKFIKPIIIDWNNLPSPSISEQVTSIQTKNTLVNVQEMNPNFLIFDLDNDGISDVVRVFKADYGYGNNKHDTWLYLSLKKGDPNYTWFLNLNKDHDKEGYEFLYYQTVADINGDGYNDLILPYYDRNSTYPNDLRSYIIDGKSLSHRNMFRVSPLLHRASRNPLITTGSFSGNGKTEIFTIDGESCGNNNYEADILYHKTENTYDRKTFTLNISEKPEKLFTGDYNSDGLTDLCFVCGNSYTIFYNQGGSEESLKFSDKNKYQGTSLTNKWRMAQGDFDGDGRLDFVYPEECDLNIAFNTGDGKFRIIKAATLELKDGGSERDDDKYTIMAFDQDGDGKSDVFACNAYYEWHGGFRRKYTFNHGCATWLYSTGSSLVPYKQVRIDREEDLLQNHIFLGDFDGNGILEVANYGGSLAGNYVFDYEKIRIYPTTNNSTAGQGKIKSITDGYGKETRISYSLGTDNTVYDNSGGASAPLISYTLPLSLVSSVTIDGGVASAQTTNYRYADLQNHPKGEGMLGFSRTTKNNITLGIKSETLIKQWDAKRFIPTEIETTTTIGSDVDKSVIYTGVTELPYNNYFSYTSKKVDTDWNNNTVTTVNKYDVLRCLPLEQTIEYGNADMYRKTLYSNYVDSGGVWRPEVIENIQKHADDSKEIALTTTCSYNKYGEATEKIEASNTPLALHHVYEFDDYGNVVSTQDVGSGIIPVTYYNEYDKSGRFVVKTHNTGSPEVVSYTYDLFGNVLTESDETNKSHVLTTKHEYDGWGAEISNTTPHGITSKTETGWGTSDSKKYYVKKTSDANPWVILWYDNTGREVLKESVLPDGVAYSQTTTYNPKGLKVKVEEKKGKLTMSETFGYDDRGRIVSEVSSTGKTTINSYGNRSVTATTDGRSYTKITDAWGNIKTSIDPVTKVDYVYSSTGKPAEITTNGSTTCFKYDEVGNNISIQSPDAGTIEYEYAADGKVLKYTDGRNITTTYTYDAEGRVVSKRVGDVLTTNTYGTSGNSINLLVKSVTNGNSVEYTHDKLGRVITETRTVNDNETYQFKYQYDDKNQLVQTTYPGDVIVKFVYDDYGYKTQTTVNDKVVCSVDSYDGLNSSSSFLNKYTTTQTLDNRGFNSSIVLSDGNNVLEQFKMNYEGSTGNLLSRKRNSLPEEAFTYDKLDRLDSIKVGSRVAMAMQYADNGNIISKTGVGSYYYDESEHPHAVSSIDNTENLVSSQECLTQFNAQNKISYIQENDLNMTIDYGPDEQRCFSVLKRGDNIIREITYLGDYEKVQEGSDVREFYYLDGNTIVIKENGVFKTYLAFTDNLGSILSVIDENGTKVFDASYDAWGKQTVTLNTIGLLRGYTGHEMLNEFNLINMNGRVYDPVLGRFLSPDKYVQEADNSQNYNSYSYCLNNPLKYTDPSGNLFGIDDALVMGVVAGAMMGTVNAKMSGKSALKGALLGGLSALATYGIGQWLGAAGSIGHELARAGLHGLSSGLYNLANHENFWDGFISGAAASGMGSFAQTSNWDPSALTLATTAAGGATAWATGGDVIQGAFNGFQIGALNFAEHGIDDPIDGGTLKGPTIKGKRIIRPRITAPQEKGLEPVWFPETLVLFGARAIVNGAIQGTFSLLESQTGGLGAWIRYGNSHSIKGGFDTKSIRWGSNKHYANKKIGNSTLRKLNQKLRETRMPFNSWRTADKGHFHWKWGSEENNEWFCFRNNKVIK